MSSGWSCSTALPAASSSIHRNRHARCAGPVGQLAWKEVRVKGQIATYIVIEDGQFNRRMPDQPYNRALITLDEDPTVNFYSTFQGPHPTRSP